MFNTNYQFRKLNENDYEKYLKLINDFRETNFSKEAFISILNKINNNNSSIWVIVIEDKLIATGTIIYEYKFIHNISILAHIEDICVSKNFRGNNYGKILINYLIEEAKKKKCYKITLYCDEKLEKFYGVNGFTKKGIQMAIYI
jgi:predicted GNAT family N-acyltransferase